MGFLATDGLLSLGFMPWAGLFIGLQCLPVMVLLAADQSKSFEDVLW